MSLHKIFSACLQDKLHVYLVVNRLTGYHPNKGHYLNCESILGKSIIIIIIVIIITIIIIVIIIIIIIIISFKVDDKNKYAIRKLKYNS